MGVGVKILLIFYFVAIRWHRRIERLEVGLLSDFRELPMLATRMPACKAKTQASLTQRGGAYNDKIHFSRRRFDS